MVERLLILRISLEILEERHIQRQYISHGHYIQVDAFMNNLSKFDRNWTKTGKDIFYKCFNNMSVV